MNRCICIHGHFYQPPRENAWLEEVEIQDSARPYHDWNERVTAESYAPNSASRILDAQDRIIDIVNNYASISFDAGPTLLAWLERSSPAVYRAILDADRQSRARFRGHGGAMAQAYNHLIMPLANSRDKRTQVVWGIRDFESRFGRKPEGMWLPETAVDLESLDIMAEHGILFTVLSPYQAFRVREIKGGEWKDATQGRVDPRMPYVCRLPSGRGIALFFYDGPISRDIAFGNLLRNGEDFAKRLVRGFSADGAGAELVHIATDGETYGHHHRFGDMALAYCLDYLETNKLAEITVYGDYLERFPPTHEAEIIERTAWSCGHGVERWRSDCGDSSGAHPGWNQKWRTPLREAMDWLGAKAAGVYEKEMAPFSQDPWGVRDDYIRVILDRSEETVEAFISGHVGRALDAQEKSRFLKLLEIERHAMLIYTSDGWFFDDISNIETIQVMQYATRTMQLVRDVTGADLEPEYVRMLGKAVSNVPRYRDGGRVYDRFVKTAFVDFLRLGAHYAVSSLFEDYPRATRIGHYSAVAEVYDREEVGKQKLAIGKVTLKSAITLEERTVSYAVVHLGDQNLTAGVREFDGENRSQRMRLKIREAFAKGDMATVLRLIGQDFGTRSYSLWHLFRDEKRKILNQILTDTLRGLEATYRQIFQTNYTVMQAIKEMQIPLPEALAAPAAFVLNADFLHLFEREEMVVKELKRIVSEYLVWSFEPDKIGLGFAAGRRAELMMQGFAAKPDDINNLHTVVETFQILKPLGLDIDLWKCQNIYFALSRTIYRDTKQKAARGNAPAKEWLTSFEELGRLLGVNPAAVREKQTGAAK
jgi:alpha-amylase/alpha-mannosidase (GH57 family)